MKKVILHGSYYGDNFGDTLFVIHYINWLRSAEGYNAQNVYLPFAGERVRGLVNVSSKKGLRCFFEGDLLVFIGGGYLGEPPSRINIWSIRLIVRHLFVGFFALALRKPFVFIGVGAGPLSNKLARMLTVYLCNKSTKVVVRDNESKDYLVKYGVVRSKIDVTADSILCLKAEDVDNSLIRKVKRDIGKMNGACKFIGVHLPAINHEELDKLNLLLDDIKHFCGTLGEYKVVVFNDFFKKDYKYAAYEAIKEKFDPLNVVFCGYEGPGRLIALINELDFVITTKLHCGIVSNCLGNYTVSISTHGKTRRLYKQLGLLERCTSFGEYQKGKLFDLLGGYSESVTFYENVPSVVRDAAGRNEEIMLDFVEKLEV